MGLYLESVAECSDYLAMLAMGAGGRNEGKQAMYLSYLN